MKKMKYPLLLLFLAPLALGQTSAGNEASTPAPATSPDQQNSAMARTIIEQGIQALGGQAYLTWRTQSSEGRSYSFHHGEPNSLGTLFWRFKQFPDKERVEITKKRDVFEIFNGDKGTEVTYRGIRNLEDKDELQPYLRRRHFSLDRVLREWINQPGVAFFYEGQTIASHKETEQVTIMNAENEAVTLNFDLNTHLPARKKFSWRDPTDQERNVEEELYDNYRTIQGIQTPYDLTRTFNGDMSAQIFITKAAYNEALDPSMFDAQATANKRR